MANPVSRRKFLSLLGGTVAVAVATAHHRPGHQGGPKPSPTPTPTTPPPPTTTTTPPPPTTTTTTPPPPVGTFGPRQGVNAVRAGAGHRFVATPAATTFSSTEELEAELALFHEKYVATGDINWDKTVQTD